MHIMALPRVYILDELRHGIRDQAESLPGGTVGGPPNMASEMISLEHVSQTQVLGGCLAACPSECVFYFLLMMHMQWITCVWGVISGCASCVTRRKQSTPRNNHE